MGFFGFLLYKKSSGGWPFSILLSFFGILVGVVLAEHVRKKYGLDHFFGKIIATPELDKEGVE